MRYKIFSLALVGVLSALSLSGCSTNTTAQSTTVQSTTVHPVEPIPSETESETPSAEPVPSATVPVESESDLAEKPLYPVAAGDFEVTTEEGYSAQISYGYQGSSWSSDPVSSAPGKTKITGSVSAIASILNTTENRQNPVRYKPGIKLLYDAESPVCGLPWGFRVDLGTTGDGPYYCALKISDFASLQSPLEPNGEFAWQTPEYISFTFDDVNEAEAEEMIESLKRPDYIMPSISVSKEFSMSPSPVTVSKDTCRLLYKNPGNGVWSEFETTMILQDGMPAPVCA